MNFKFLRVSKDVIVQLSEVSHFYIEEQNATTITDAIKVWVLYVTMKSKTSLVCDEFESQGEALDQLSHLYKLILEIPKECL